MTSLSPLLHALDRDKHLSEASPSHRPPIRKIKGLVTDATQETSDTWTLHIQVDPSDKNYRAGQFITIDPHQFPELSHLIAFLEHKKGRKEAPRAYSLASAPFEPHIAITIKTESFNPQETPYPSLLSPLLACSAFKGRPIEFVGYTGPYTLTAEHGHGTKEVLHVVAGSGVVPNYAILKDELRDEKNPHIMHTLINVNKTKEDIIYHRDLELLAQHYAHRFRMAHLLTQDPQAHRHGPHYFAGRPTLDFIQDYIEDTRSVLVYVCGSAITKWERKKATEEGTIPAPRFLETILDIMQQLGVDRKRLKREAW